MTTTSNLSASGRETSGRFAKGSSGNLRGRPSKKKEDPWTWIGKIAAELDEEVEISEGGKQKKIKVRDYALKCFVRSLPKAKPSEQLKIYRQLSEIGALTKSPPEYESIFTEEDRRLIEMVQAEVKVIPCEHCGKPPSA